MASVQEQRTCVDTLQQPAEEAPRSAEVSNTNKVGPNIYPILFSTDIPILFGFFASIFTNNKSRLSLFFICEMIIKIETENFVF